MVNSIHTAPRHVLTRTPPRKIANKASFSEYNLPIPLICVWASCQLDVGGSRHGWGLFLQQTELKGRAPQTAEYASPPALPAQSIYSNKFLTILLLDHLIRREELAGGGTGEGLPQDQADWKEATEGFLGGQEAKFVVQEVGDEASVEEVTDG